VQKYGRARQATDDDMTHVHYMLDTQGYRHTLTICNTYCFSTATMAARTRLDVAVIRTLAVLFNNTANSYSFYGCY
jgi:hypothetical protein